MGAVVVTTPAGIGASRLARRAERVHVLLAAPAVVFLLVLFAYPVGRLMLLSVEGGTLAHFQKALTDGLYLYVFWKTFQMAVLVTAGALVLAYPVAHWLATASPAGAAVGFTFLLLPFWTSLLVRTYAWMVLLGRNGVINRALLANGIVTEPVDLMYNTFGVFVGMVHVLTPYVVFPLYSVMRRIDDALLAAAAGLGASPWQVFRRVYLPLTRPGIIAGCTLVFILALGFFITPALLGGGRVVLIATLIEEQVRQFLNWGFASALAVVLLAATVLLYLGVNRTLRGRLTWS